MNQESGGMEKLRPGEPRDPLLKQERKPERLIKEKEEKRDQLQDGPRVQHKVHHKPCLTL